MSAAATSPPQDAASRVAWIIHVHGLSHLYRRRRIELEVLHGVAFEVAVGEYVSLVGASGSGKTTLLSLLGGLDRPQTGSVIVGGHDLTTLSGDELASFRRDVVGFVFQHFGLLEALTALENVELALRVAGVTSLKRRDRAEGLLSRVGLGGRRDHRPSQLSGGERQRVAIARAIANEPRVILADEPTGNLDDDTAANVIELLEQLNSEDGRTLVIVTHQRRVALRANRRLGLVSGGLRELDGSGELRQLERSADIEP